MLCATRQQLMGEAVTCHSEAEEFLTHFLLLHLISLYCKYLVEGVMSQHGRE